MDLVSFVLEGVETLQACYKLTDFIHPAYMHVYDVSKKRAPSRITSLGAPSLCITCSLMSDYMLSMKKETSPLPYEVYEVTRDLSRENCLPTAQLLP